ncbi:hypothetical protein Goarm_001190 [Gossypium armourianum]|uniref:Uncharacterized protein n=1 Tax=Gossypium armourianum TaxID=34283 RepID=A0A7J9KC62_9ROSI|nr:hypothetical protein [Gossypium armourianum]
MEETLTPLILKEKLCQPLYIWHVKRDLISTIISKLAP